MSIGRLLLGAALLAAATASHGQAQWPQNAQARPNTGTTAAQAAAAQANAARAAAAAPAATAAPAAPPGTSGEDPAFASTPTSAVDAQYIESQLTLYPVFGQSLFQGNFAQQSFKGFNPDYLISVGDVIDLRMWGAFETQIQLIVDAQGNIFVPKVGPIHVINTPNSRLNEAVEAKVRSVFRSDVGIYATLASAVPVKVFVAGFVRRPGLYPGFASDSVLTFLDRAGGVHPLSGSYLDVQVLRNGEVIAKLDLYKFLTEGYLPLKQLRDGDSIFVGPIGPTVTVSGLVTNSAQFEFKQGMTINDVLAIAGRSGRATHVRVARNVGEKRDAFYVPVGDAFLDSELQTGDEIQVTADRLVGQIAVAVEGEHESAGYYVLPYSATLQDLLDQIRYSPQSNPVGLQLYRKSVAARQQAVLQEMLQKLEQSALAPRSWTTEEAQLRTQEAQLILQFIDRAKNIVPKGQVVLYEGFDPATIALEDGDVVRIPRVSNLVHVHGEVYLPNSFVWRKRMDAGDYIGQAGGVLQKSASDRVLVMRPSGEIALGSDAAVNPGDEVMVLPAVDTKKFQFSKDIIQVIYQIAIAAGVVARL